ncbi:MAG: hypothetical protein KDA64_11605 [Rhodospirillaceae bacterium]|nr:hypothetical protein [Rhodospirillaceae bacterium]
MTALAQEKKMPALSVEEALKTYHAVVARKRDLAGSIPAVEDDIAALTLAKTVGTAPEGADTRLAELEATRAAAEREMAGIEGAIALATRQLAEAKEAERLQDAGAKWGAVDQALDALAPVAAELETEIAALAAKAKVFRDIATDAVRSTMPALKSLPHQPSNGWNSIGIPPWDDLTKLGHDVSALLKKSGLDLIDPMREDAWQVTPTERLKRARKVLDRYRAGEKLW